MSIIKKVDEKVQRIYEIPEEQWSRKLKEVKTSALRKSIVEIIDRTSRKETKVWVYASALLNELWARHYAKERPQVLEMMRDTIMDHSHLCLIDGTYGVEAGGIRKKIVSPHASEKKVVHPYVYSKNTRKIVAKWDDSESEKSFDEYVKYFSKDTRRSLKGESVLYLTKDERDDYLVSFTKDNEIKIGGKSPKDGTYIFALSADGKKLLAAEKIKGKLQHSSFFAGLAVQSAGKFDIKRKKITRISLSSGHYKPTEAHIDNLRRFLKKDENLGKKHTKELSIKTHS